MTPPPESDELVARAAALADEVLFPGAPAVDAAALVPVERLDALADAGLYGLLGPREVGGHAATPATFARVLEELARGCLTTAFVFAQHHGTVRTLASGPPALAEAFLGPLCRGELRAGVAFSGLRRPGPPALVAHAAPGGGYVLRGSASWVTGWGRVDLIHVAARRAGGDVVWALCDATESASLRAEPLALGAVAASGTVALHFADTPVPPERVSAIEPFPAWQARDALGLRPNGAFALGCARRCGALAGDPASEAAAASQRARLDAAGPEALPAERAAACALAVTAAARCVASTGGRAVLSGSHVERLWREAGFLLVFGQTPAIRAAELAALPAPSGAR